MWKVASGIFLGWGLGGNDSANIFGTGVATGIIKYRTAIFLTAIFVVIGALLEGQKPMAIVGELSRLIPIAAFGCTLGAGITMGVLTYLAIPASASQAIIGAVMGASILSGSADFSRLYKIVSCWILTPIGGIVIAFFLHRVLGHLLEKWVRSIRYRNLVFSVGIIAAGCYGAYSLGSNNVANVTGVYVGSGLLTPLDASLIGGLSIAGGVLTYSKKVMMTVGRRIVPLDPFSAFIAVLSEALTLHIFTQIGVPVSSSQAIVGAVVGIGLVRDFRAVSFRMLAEIAIGWVSTPISAGLLSYLIIRGIT